MKKKVLTVLLALVLSFSLVAAVPTGANSGTTWYVATDGSDEFGNGSETWVDVDESGVWSAGDTGPWATIQCAIDDESVLSFDTILVYPGEYVIDEPATEYACIIIDVEALTVKALNPAATLVDPLDPSVASKIVVGDIEWLDEEADVINIAADGVTFNGFTVVGADHSVDIYGVDIYDWDAWDLYFGCIITNNYITGNSADGIYVDGEEHTISNNIITDNESSGIYIWEDSAAISILENNFQNNGVQLTDEFAGLNIEQVLADNVFDRAVVVDREITSLLPTIWSSIQDGINAAVTGDTVHVAAGDYNEDITLKNGVQVLGAGEASTIINGTGTGSVVTASGVGPTTKLDGFTITGGNTNTYGGGMYIYNNSSLTVTNCTFFDNTTTYDGGGMCNDSSSPTVTNCTFYNNTAMNGGGMQNYWSSATVTNCTFYNNTATRGGGIHNENSSSEVTNCIFYGNIATAAYGGDGGAIYNYAASPKLINCTFSGNWANYYGGAMYSIYDSTPTVTNCILWGDSIHWPDYYEGPEILDWLKGTVGNEHPSTTTVTYSDVQGGWVGTGNKNINPLFSNAAAGDYHLESGSPCIDAGNNAAVPPGVTTDFEGDPRIMGATVDMGADEVVPYEVWVDDGFTESTPGWGLTHFAAIQPAIDIVVESGMVNVAAGRYEENIVIDKTLTLEGANAGVPATGVRGPESIINAQLAEFAVLINGANTVATFDGFTVENYDTIGVLGGGFSTEIEGVALGDDPIAVHILNNIVKPPTIEAPHNNNIQIGDGTTGTIIGNEVSGALLESPDWSGSGIIVAGSSNVLISYNYVHNSEGGIQIIGYAEYRNAPAENNIIEYNLVEGNESGIVPQMNSIGTIIRYNDVLNNDEGIAVMAIDYPWPEHSTPSGTQVHFNNIVGNTAGVVSGVWGSDTGNILAEEVDATLNWWGDATGPKQLTTNPCASGDEASDNVNYIPWLDATYPGGSERTYNVENTDTFDTFNSIQAAIDDADTDAGHTIQVYAGMYDLTAPIVVDKSVTLTGDVTTPSNVIVDATMAGDDRDGFQIKASGITIQGFKIQGAQDTVVSQNCGVVIGTHWVGEPTIAGLERIEISYNEFVDCSKGIFMWQVKDSTVSYNTFTTTEGQEPDNFYDEVGWGGDAVHVYLSVASDYPTGNTISHNTMDNVRVGVFLNGDTISGTDPSAWDFSGTTIEDNTMTDVWNAGIMLQCASGTAESPITINLNDINTSTGRRAGDEGNERGLISVHGDYTVITSNTLTNSEGHGLWVDGSHHIVEGNIVTSNTKDGIHVGAYKKVEPNNGWTLPVITRADITLQTNNLANVGLGQAAIFGEFIDSIAILGNTVSDFVKGGIVVKNVLLVQIEGNIISTTDHSAAPNGIQIGYVTDLTSTTGTVNDNQISGCSWDGYDPLTETYEDDWTGSGILVIAPDSALEISGNEVQSCDVGLDIETGPDTFMANNDVHDNSYGFVLWNALPAINFNNIYQNALGGVYRTSGGDLTGTLDATNNFWGTKDGAAIATMVSADVDYDPWFGAGVEDSKSEETGTGEVTVDATTETDTQVVKTGDGTPTITVTEYTDNPGGGTPGGFSSVGDKYIDVHIDDTTGVTEIEIRNYYTLDDIAGLVEATLKLSWWDGTAWIECSDSGATYPAGEPTYRGYVWAKIRATGTTPTLDELAGTPFMPMGKPPAPPPPPPSPAMYIETNLFGVEEDYEIDSDGEIQETFTATSEDGMLTMTIPEGTITLDEEGERLETLEAAVDETPPSPPEDAHIIGLAYDFGPDGVTFDPPITLEYSYDPEALPEGVAEADLVLAYYDETTGEWVELDCVVDTENNIITASVAHFTTFAVIGTVTEEEEVAPPPAPAAFTVSSLGVSPSELAPGEEVNISVLVANTGGKSGSYTVVLKIDGVKEAEERVTIAAGSSRTVSFSVTKEEADSYTVAVNGLSGSFTVAPVVVPPEPAAFSVSNLSVTPLEVEPGATITIAVSMANTGGESGSYTVVLKVNEVKEAEKTVTIAAGESQDVTFSVTKEEAGTYTVAVDGLSGSFTVVPVVVPPAPPRINWPLIGGIIGGVIVVGLLIYFLVFRRRAY